MALNVLLVDDSATMRKVLAKTLRLTRLPIEQIREAGNGQEGLDALHEHWFDLVVADIHMPVMDGLEMIDRMASEGLLNDIPVIIVSSDGNRANIEHLASKGVVAFCRKPFTPEQIREFVLVALGGGHEFDRRSIISRAFCDVMEKQAFLFPETLSVDEVPQFDPDSLIAHMEFDGEVCGDLSMVASSNVAREVAAGLLGLDPEDDDVASSVGDAFAELLNVACAHVLTGLYGDSPNCSLSPPRIEGVDPARWEELVGSPDVIGFVINEKPLFVRLSVHDPSLP